MKKKALNRPFAGLRKRLAQPKPKQPKPKAAPGRGAAEPSPPIITTEESFASLAAAASSQTIRPLAPAPARISPAGPAPALHAADMPAPVCEEYELSRRDGGYIEGRRADVDPAELELLRRAQPRSVVDLHGMVAAQARRHLHRALARHHRRGERELLVIVGKGLHSPDGRAVLRDGIPLWLSEAHIAGYVRAFVTARREHGGRGSLYVRVRP